MTASASAQPAQVQADVLFRQGKALMAQQKFGEACAAFERSHQLDPKNMSTLLNHANCREKNGQLATAWRLFLEAEREMRPETDDTSKKYHPVAAARAGELVPRLSKLSINVAPDRQLVGLEISRDSDRVDPGEWNRTSPIDGGTYTITARAPGRNTWSTTLVVKSEGDNQVIEVPKLEDSGTPVRPPSSPAAATRRDVPAPAARGPRRSLVLPIAMGAGALVLGSTAFGFSRWGDRIYDDALQGATNAERETLWRSANQRRYAAIGFAAGAVGCAGAAIYLYLRRGSGEATPPLARRSLRVEPIASVNTLGVGLHGHW
jgi:hypothetical protein